MQSFPERTQSAEETPGSALPQRLFNLVKVVLMPTDERFQLLVDNDLSFGQAKALIHLTRNEEPMSGGALAESIGASAPAASRSLDSLVQRGLADRSESAEDRRVRLFSATTAGSELAAELAALRRAQVEAFAAELPPELAERLDLLLLDLEAAGVIDPPCGEHS